MIRVIYLKKTFYALSFIFTLYTFVFCDVDKYTAWL